MTHLRTALPQICGVSALVLSGSGPGGAAACAVAVEGKPEPVVDQQPADVVPHGVPRARSMEGQQARSMGVPRARSMGGQAVPGAGEVPVYVVAVGSDQLFVHVGVHWPFTFSMRVEVRR